MKFLVLALCVCAASAASFGGRPSGYQPPYGSFAPGSAGRIGNQAVSPFAKASAAVYQSAKQVASAAYQPAQQVATAAYQPAQQAAAAAYQPAQQAASAVFEPAQQVAAAVVAAPKVAAVAAYQGAQQFATKTYSAAKDAEASIVRSDSEVSADGYSYNYETGNGISGQASGTLKKVGEEAVLVSQGSYSYVDPEGKTVNVNYVADENGFQPQSDILPVGPAIPEAIARALAYIAAHPSTSAEKY